MTTTIFSKTERRLTIATLGLLLATFFFDDLLLSRGVGLRFNWLDGLMLFLTDFGLVFLIVVVLVSLLLQKKFHLFTLFFISLMLSFEFSYLAKMIFQTPRPYYNLDLATIPLTQASGFSFPSLHSAICFALLPLVWRMFDKKWQRLTVFISALVITYSRAYLGVHYFSDIIAGGLIGYFFSKLLLYTELRFHAIDWFLEHVKSKLELRRQIAHLLLGLLIVFFIELKLLTPQILFMILILGGALSLLYKRKPIPIIHEILVWLERPKDLASFPGKGPFFLVLGSLLSLTFFPVDIAKGAIMVLAVGDSVSHVVGRYFGKTRIPFSNHKKMEGTIVAIILSVLGALLFVDFPKAFLGSLITMCFEAIYPGFLSQYIDDNVMVPLLAGGVMMMLI